MNDRENGIAPNVNSIAQSLGIPYPVRVSEQLQAVLMPNEFISGLGIQIDDRIRNMLAIVKEGFVPHRGGPEETLPETGLTVPFMVTQGPYIRETTVGIKAELQLNDDGKREITLAVIQDPH